MQRAATSSRNAFLLLTRRWKKKFRTFCRECVFYDIGLNRYTKQELLEAPDLLEFLTKTAKNRNIAIDGELVPCEKAFTDMKPVIEKLDMDTIDFGMLLGQENTAKQKFAVDLLEQELFSGPSQKTSWGAIGATAILWMRSFLEALLYLAFPLIVLFSLLSFGIRVLLQWARMVLWIATWPIFFVAVDLFLDALWVARKKSLFAASAVDYTLATSHKLSILYTSMEMAACLALAAIPFISWLLIKGGISQLVSFSASSPEQTKTTIETLGAPPSFESMEESRQTHSGTILQEVAISDNGFKTVVDDARTEERADTAQHSLSSIRSSVKDLAKTVPGKTEPGSMPEIVTVKGEGKDENWSGNKMDNPSHGSWSE